jgi:hypothetical protein
MCRRFHVGLVVLATLLVACGGSRPVEPARSPVAGSTGATGPTASTPEILRFRAPELSGGVLRGADYAGRDLALWFWAPW